jgi:hypothetical protein
MYIGKARVGIPNVVVDVATDFSAHNMGKGEVQEAGGQGDAKSLVPIAIHQHNAWRSQGPVFSELLCGASCNKDTASPAIGLNLALKLDDCDTVTVLNLICHGPVAVLNSGSRSNHFHVYTSGREAL